VKKNKIKILIVDDEPDIIEILQFNLENEGYKVISAVNGKEGLKLADQYIPHLIILDLMMPVMDGIEACERLRMDKKFNNSVIMFLSARGEDYSQVAAFEAGADDYITKPIKPRVLNSKVKALLRRFKNEFSQILSFKNIVIDSEQYTVLVDNKTHDLPRKEFELLFLLASKPGKVFKRERIMESVWGTDVIVGDRTIDVHIRKLREKIGKNLFKTIKGVGYQFVINE
jgi:two-component system alkaline phosphatase synthesis response regulator PhoP